MADQTSNSEPVAPELLRTELNGGTVDESDYFARSTLALQDIQLDTSNLDNYRHEDSISFEEIGYLVETRDLAMENGYVRRKDGSIYVAVTLDLGHDVNGEMFDWWFCNCDNTEKYRWWHPKDHVTGTWDPPYYGAMAFERPRGHYVDHVHIVDEKISGVVQSVQIEFQRPSKFFDVSKFPEQGITAMLVGRIYVKDSLLGLVAAGHLVHMVRQESDGRSTLKSRFWMGDISYPETPENYFFASSVNFLVNSYLARVTKIPFNFGLGIYKHCYEEMHCLKEFLPHYYRVAQEEQSQMMRKFSFAT